VHGTPSVKRDWQVFGLSGASRGGGLLGAASQPCITRASALSAGSEESAARFVPDYRCGAVPDSHRIPS